MSADQWFREQARLERWFADKGRTIADVSIIWTYRPPDSADVTLFVAEFGFEDGPTSAYFAALDPTCEQDTTASPEFTTWLLGSLIDDSGLPPELAWEGLADLPGGTTAGPGRALGVQQSNTSIRYPGDVLIKVNRRLAVGISPEVELSAVMQRSEDRSATTTTYGALLLDLPASGRACLAIASKFVPNVGDGWSTMQELLRDVRAASDFAVTLAEVTAVAEVTASMHRALVSDPWRRPVAPEAITATDIERWTTSATRELDQLLTDIQQRKSSLPGDLAQLIDFVQGAEPELRARLNGFGALLGSHRMRVHGDFHLGQVLRSSDGRYVAIDFDGEPERPLGERRQKYSALRDVAGMLRSFAYARGTVELVRSGTGEAIAVLREWEARARECFLETYIAGIARRQFSLLPPSADDIRQALEALELEKAIYECRYEINNRPEWLWLPLTRLVREG